MAKTKIVPPPWTRRRKKEGREVVLIKAKSYVGMVDDKMEDHTVMNGVSNFLPPCFVFSLRNRAVKQTIRG